jgi:hypothetical protein
MLTEDTARAQLKPYCEPLREVEWVRSDFQRYHSWTDVAIQVVDLVVVSPYSQTAT